MTVLEDIYEAVGLFQSFKLLFIIYELISNCCP